jgi:hypothetical protein
MIEKKIVLAILLIIPLFLNGQDLIFKNDNSVIEGLIQEWNDSIVQYILKDQPIGDLHFLSTHYIDSIRFQNGQVEKFNSFELHDTGIKQKGRRTYLGIGLLDPVIYTNLRFTYERRFGAGSFGLFIPLTIGLEDKVYYSERSLNYRIGLGINFHVPRKQGNSLYVIGMNINGGSYVLHDWDSQFDSQTFFNLTNSHSMRIHINEWLILAPGVDFHLIGYSSHFFGIGLPFVWGLRFDVLFNL